MQLAVVADELTAVGWRLAGAHTWVPGVQPVAECLLAASRDADVLLITAALAAAVPDADLQRLLQVQTPLTLIIPDARRAVDAPDLEHETRRALGVAP